jgi:ATP:corrinoid adenosyltransferase
MTNEEMEKTMQFILEQQAQFTTNFQKIEAAREKDEEARKKDSARITRLEESFQLLVQLAQNHDERLVTLDERLVTLAEAQIRTSEQIAAMNERTAETDERLNALIAVVERYISSKGQNGSPQS